MPDEEFIQGHATIIVKALALQSELDEVVSKLVDISKKINEKETGITAITEVLLEAERVMDAIDSNIAILRELLPKLDTTKQEKNAGES